jgi:hypothetical protein
MNGKMAILLTKPDHLNSHPQVLLNFISPVLLKKPNHFCVRVIAQASVVKRRRTTSHPPNSPILAPSKTVSIFVPVKISRQSAH